MQPHTKRNILTSLRIRIVILVFLAILPSFALILGTALEQRKGLIRDAQTNALRFAKLAALNQQEIIDGTRQLLFTLSQLPVVQKRDSSECGKLFRQLVKQYSYYANFGIADLHGKVICSAYPLVRETNIEDRTYFREALQTSDFSVGEYQIGRITGIASLNFGFPLYDVRNNKIGVLYAATNLTWLTQLIREAQLPAQSSVTVIDRNAIILARYPETGLVGKSAHESSLIKSVLNQQEGVAQTVGIDGVSSLIGFTSLKKAPKSGLIFISAEIPEDVALSEVNTELLRNLLSLSIVAVLALCAAWFGSEFLVLRGVHAVSNAARKMAAGDLSARTGLNYAYGELGELAKVFDEMAISLEKRIVEHNKTVKALEASEEYGHNIIRSSLDMIIAVDRERKITEFNKAAEEAFGYSKDEVIERHVSVLYADPEEGNRVHKVTVEHGRCVQEIQNKRKNGEVFPSFLSASILRDSGGELVGVMGISRDITELKKLQHQLLQAQKMESIGTLAGGIAHDFNNILGIILGYSTLLEGMKDDKVRFSESVEKIQKAVQRGANLVRQILTFARKSEPRLEPINVNGLVHELHNMISDTFPKIILINQELERDIPYLYGDHSQMHQALLNLCVNARDAMPSGGNLVLKTRTVSGEELRKKFTLANESNYVCITVSDTGMGMDEYTRSRIFEPFFSTKKKGTGLGLAVTYGVLQSHNGHIDVESEIGRGSTFHLYFPIPSGNKAIEDVKKEEEKALRGSETILFVEDEEMLIDMVKAYLMSQGYKVLAAMDGAEAVKIYKSHKDEIAIVVTDIGLPRLTGVDEFKELKKINPEVKVIIVSGYLDSELKSELLKEGARDFIQKPYEPKEIIRRIREVLNAS